jgi:hypothetical protein
MNSSFDMPTLEVASVRAGKSSRANAAHGRALPEAVVNVGQVGFSATRIRGRLPDGNAPRRGWNLIAGDEKLTSKQDEQEQGKPSVSWCHGVRECGLAGQETWAV